MTTRDDNVRVLRRRQSKAPDEGISTHEIEDTLLVEFQSKSRSASHADLLRAAADWLDEHPGATPLALNIQFLEDDPEETETLLEMIIQG